MTLKVTSVTGIHFLTPPTFISAVRKIEEYLPGWWWSLSQMTGKITLTTGPSQNSPDLRDLAFSKTRKGDEGLINLTCHSSHDSETSFLSWLDQTLAICTEHRHTVEFESLSKDVSTQSSLYRKQSTEDLDTLLTSYSAFLAKVELFENNKRLLDEIYLGSCDLSVDCSLRGKRANGQKFDVSVDLTGADANLSESLDWSVVELYSDILTP